MTLAAKNKDKGKTYRRLTDLVTKSRDHHGKAREELNGSRVEMGNDSGQEPLVLCQRHHHSQDPGRQRAERNSVEACYSPPQISLYAEVMKIGLSAPRVPIIGNSRVCDALALVDLLKRAKSGILTARLEKRPMITLSACRADHTRPTFGLISVGPWTSGPPPLVTITALREKVSREHGSWNRRCVVTQRKSALRVDVSGPCIDFRGRYSQPGGSDQDSLEYEEI